MPISVSLRPTGPILNAVGSRAWKARSLVVLIALVSATLTLAQLCSNPPSGIIAWWPAEGNANDIIGANNGIVEGAATFAPGKVEQAFQFNGTEGGNGIRLGNVPSLDFSPSSSFTIEAWINTFGPTFSGAQFIVALNYECTSTRQSLDIDNATGKVDFSVRDANDEWGRAISPSALSTNTFHHIAGVREVTETGKMLKLYVDGVLADEVPDLTTGSLAANVADFIGRRFGCADTSTFNGLVDEVSIYDRALTAAEIATIFGAGSAGKCKPNVGPVSSTNIWVGLANSDDVGIRFDLRAEVYRNFTQLAAAGEIASVAGGSSGFNNAHDYKIDLIAVPGAPVNQGDTLSITLYARNACVGSGKNSGRARLWYDDAAANSRFAATVGNSATYFLRSGFTYGGAPGAGPKKTIDLQAGPKCSPYKPFGTWNNTLPF